MPTKPAIPSAPPPPRSRGARLETRALSRPTCFDRRGSRMAAAAAALSCWQHNWKLLFMSRRSFAYVSDSQRLFRAGCNLAGMVHSSTLSKCIQFSLAFTYMCVCVAVWVCVSFFLSQLEVVAEADVSCVNVSSLGLPGKK